MNTNFHVAELFEECRDVVANKRVEGGWRCPVPHPIRGQTMSSTVDECTCTHGVFSTIEEARVHFFKEHDDFALWDDEKKTPRLQKLTNEPSLKCFTCKHSFGDLQKMDEHVIGTNHAAFKFNVQEKKPTRRYDSTKRRAIAAKYQKIE